MANYLLLRDNKETGPFSLEELISYGLKPYDLVWVAGKSAAWRYPSELNELKPYAPTVEEQPFDRFYKKTSLEEAEQPALKAAQTSSVNDQYQAYAPKVQAETETVKPVARKSVFVTMPGQTAASAQKVAVKSAPVPKPVPAPIPDYTLPDMDETISVSEKQVAKVKYSQPLDEIKEMYVKTLKDRKDRIAREGFLRISVKRAAVVLGLIGVGVLAGFILKSRPADNGSLASQVPPAAGSLAVNGEVENVPSSDEQSANPITESALEGDQQEDVTYPAESKTVSSKLNSDKQAASILTQANDAPPTFKKEDNNASQEKKKPLAVMTPGEPGKPDQEQHEYAPSEVNSSTGERTRSARKTLNEMTIKTATENANHSSTASAPVSAVPDNALSGLGSQVSVVSNDYKRVALGGIRNLELTVTNRSKYALDEVAVELQYFKPNDQVLKTQVVQFKSVAANESETLRIPDTNRGVRVQYKIVRIGSSQLADR
ncbi:hypothetical protein LZZ85_04930 [Terrimonas sp. NA20]|uniref:DUF4339 domain-containing protein n=1 Tax=Terrimonas ginsenosidimutans TaxID=2908004 RepID=A0ABS9KMQ1_9BACT|nr:hypothetical protein [Terrimonas ginsenosidimutans]MCG2613610.1 hypothetical protein [Terrimonas ginsenosidimutans]